jgi:hypothetical protein
MINNNDHISVIEYVNQLKTSTIKNIRLLETDVARNFDEVIEICSELVKQNISLAKTIEELKKEEKSES